MSSGRVCADCKQRLPSQGRGRPRIRCRVCAAAHRLSKLAEQQRTYYANNREKVAEQQRTYYANNREKVAEQQRTYREANDVRSQLLKEKAERAARIAAARAKNAARAASAATPKNRFEIHA